MPLTRAQIYRRRRVAVFGGLAAVLAVLVYLPATLLAPVSAAEFEPVPRAPVSTVAAAPAFPAYGGGAVGAVGWEGVLAAAGDPAPRPIASITKVVTALVVLDAHPLAPGEPGPTVETTTADVALYDSYLARNGKVVSVRPGLQFTQRELLDLVLIESANNYAETLATWAFGSHQAYVDAANAWVASNGLTQTTIVDSTGMSPDNRSSTADLVRLGELALAHPLVAEIVATPTVQLHDIGRLDNTNALLGVGGVDGIKTGTLDEAGACLLFAADLPVGGGTVTVVGAVLGAEDHDQLDADVQALLASVAPGFQEITLATEGEVVGSYTSEWGDRSDLVVEGDHRTIVWSDAPVETAVDSREVHLAEAGADAGVLRVTVAGETTDVPLRLASAIDDPGPWWRLTNPVAVLF